MFGTTRSRQPGPLACAAVAVGEHLVRRRPLVAGIEGAEAAASFAALVLEIRGSFAPFRRDDDPAAGDRIFS